MLNIALFISGRLLGFETCLLPFINKLKIKYNIYVFFSINIFSLDKDANLETISNSLKTILKESFGGIRFEEYKMPKTYIENRIKNKINVFTYNCLSCFYNDFKCMELIEQFEQKNNINFDIICKTRSDMISLNDDYTFIVDDKSKLIIRNKHLVPIRYWGHCYNNTPLMISDAFAYGNKQSMKYYVSTYDFILKNDFLMNGEYSQTFEIYLTDSILQYIFYNKPGGDNIPRLTQQEIHFKYNNIPNGCKIYYINDFNYKLLPTKVRSKNNFIVDINNVLNYTQT
jgi:hypothetical protein